MPPQVCFSVFFLLFHLLNNLVIYTGAENFNFLVASLEKIKPLIRILEVGLATILIVHIYNSVSLSLQARKSGNVTTKSNIKNHNASLSSRTMLLLVVYYLFLSLYIFQHFGSIFRIIMTIQHTTIL
ncbi:MAG: hypothetical protein Ct9H90mP20_2410 [Candidatus Neomarinimicrobiota bacterium]|nr:MAG: hypothetical protein Ct9H90mP20_2410 [Candidatus Neomarinimicrobiota bacterium]